MLPVYQDVLKVTFQALAVGALGGLAKLIVDRRKAGELAGAELRDRRYRYISNLVELARSVDEARLVVHANQSVESWTDVINERIILPHCRLRDIIHDLENWAETGTKVFIDKEGIKKDLHGMDCYLIELLDEYAEHKQALGEEQLWAEQAKGKTNKEREERKRLLNSIWAQMLELPVLGDLVEDGDGYGAFRTHYRAALLKMRQSLAVRK